jgi:hypothetical protein
MAEMLQTERAYIADLEELIETFSMPMINDSRIGSRVPPSIKGKHDLIFANVEAIHQFHKLTFHPELAKCEGVPEKVGDCFVKWVRF